MSSRKTRSYTRPRHYRSWSESEEQALSNGVKRHGVGAWEAIRKDPDLSVLRDRTGVQLKDKWRNMVKFKHVSQALFTAAEPRKPRETERDERRQEPMECKATSDAQTSSCTDDAGGLDTQQVDGSVRSGSSRCRRQRYRRPLTTLEDKRFGIYDIRRYINKSNSAGSGSGLLAAACEEADDDDEKEGEGDVACLCGVTVDDGAMMVECEACLVWSHVHCLKAFSLSQPDFDFHMNGYVCPSCQGLLSSSQGTSSAGQDPSSCGPKVCPPAVSAHSMDCQVPSHEGSVHSLSTLPLDATVADLAERPNQSQTPSHVATPVQPIGSPVFDLSSQMLSPFALPSQLTQVLSPVLDSTGSVPFAQPLSDAAFAPDDILDCIAQYSMDPESKVHGGSLAAFALAAASLDMPDIPTNCAHLMEHASSYACGISNASLEAAAMELALQQMADRTDDDDPFCLPDAAPEDCYAGWLLPGSDSPPNPSAMTAIAVPPRFGQSAGVGCSGTQARGVLGASLLHCTSPPASTSFASSADVMLAGTPTSQRSHGTLLTSAVSLPAPVGCKLLKLPAMHTQPPGLHQQLRGEKPGLTSQQTATPGVQGDPMLPSLDDMLFEDQTFRLPG